MRKRIGLALAGIVGTVIVGVPSSAQAASCPSGYICWFNNSDGTGLLESGEATFDVRTRCYKMATTVTNRVSYVVNNSAYLYNVYDGTTCTGTPGVIYAHSQGPMTGVWNDSISSYVRA